MNISLPWYIRLKPNTKHMSRASLIFTLSSVQPKLTEYDTMIAGLTYNENIYFGVYFLKCFYDVYERIRYGIKNDYTQILMWTARTQQKQSSAKTSRCCFSSR